MSFEVKPGLSADGVTTATNMNIIGCDYSAAKAQPNATWLASGRLASGRLASGNLFTRNLATSSEASSDVASSNLYIDRLENIGSDKLLENLLSLKGPPDETGPALQTGSAWLIGLDFPFSLPRPFIDILFSADKEPGAGSSPGSRAAYSNSIGALTTWVEVAKEISNLTFDELVAMVQVAKPIMGGEVKRQTDNSTDPKAQSPLHQINPGMLKMTWQGMQLLLALHQQGFAILPFAEDARLDRPLPAQVIEVYPAAVLKALGLPWRKYKGKDQEAKQLRQFILSNLTDHTDKLRTVNRINSDPIKLELSPHLQQIALESDDALDAVIAAVGATIAYLNPSQTAPPSHILPDSIALEGWIYVPYPKTVQATT